MTNVTLGGKPYTLVIDSGSSDTWVAASTFKCLSVPGEIPDSPTCGFGARFDESSPTFKPLPGPQVFSVNYTSSEFLRGRLGSEILGIGRVGLGLPPLVTARQVIGVVEEGYWNGDGISSGLMGLAYPDLASSVRELGYTSALFTLANTRTFSPVWSLALARPSTAAPAPGGQLALGGIPNTRFGDWAQVPILRTRSGGYGFYTVTVDGFSIAPPVGAGGTSSGSGMGLYGSGTANGVPLGAFVSQGTTAMIDSGTTLLYLPRAIADALAGSFVPPAAYNTDSGLYIVPCDAAAPRFGVVIGGKTFYMHLDDMMNRRPGAVGGPGVGAGSGMCALAVQRALGGAVLGDAWLRGVLIIVNMADNSVIVGERENY